MGVRAPTPSTVAGCVAVHGTASARPLSVRVALSVVACWCVGWVSRTVRGGGSVPKRVTFCGCEAGPIIIIFVMRIRRHSLTGRLIRWPCCSLACLFGARALLWPRLRHLVAGKEALHVPFSFAALSSHQATVPLRLPRTSSLKGARRGTTFVRGGAAPRCAAATKAFSALTAGPSHRRPAPALCRRRFC
jgi:hypothetical protein